LRERNRYGFRASGWSSARACGLADELRDLPGLKPEVNYLLKMFK
jgi:hypothetical protein